MDEDKFLKIIQTIFILTVAIFLLTIVLGVSGVYFYQNPEFFSQQKTSVADTTASHISKEVYSDSIHNATGFIQGENLDLVIANCTGCHSSKLIIQNRATKEGWKSMIIWMQETQNLPDLGENEEKILSYLAKYYAPAEHGRRKPLTGIEWYTLE